MRHNKGKKLFAMMMATTVVATSIPFSSDISAAINATKNYVKNGSNQVIKLDVDASLTVKPDENTPFSWDNANLYFMLTDRFNNGDKTNDHSYGRSVGEVDADNYETRIGTFHGGDLKGITQKINEGYFDKLGTNAIWITAPYEQIHGALASEGFKHYSYHGYYTLDYTEVDKNMGSAKDLETFINTAHAHGIRVVFDVVMNHAGYADPVTVNEYFGEDTTALSENWKEIYYDTDEKAYRWYNTYDSEAAKYNAEGMLVSSSDEWTQNWWGTDWIRCLSNRFKGYEGVEGSGKTECLSGLPDFKTESKKEVSLPAILKAKWTKEGTYDAKCKLTQDALERTGEQANVSGYIVSWLSQWVAEYGVDGFRCDTAKHIETAEWGNLKNACADALKIWRENNPNKPGAEWSDDFWMTGEDFGRGVTYGEYYKSGGFDSMINFAFKGKEKLSGSKLESTYKDYAEKINSRDDFNVLTFISSHDSGLGERSTNAAVALMLLPGGVQTYYGDESGRTSGNIAGEQGYRTQMNWDSIDEKLLSVWQKLGSFRRNHIAVGAGKHAKICDSPYTFSRTYTGNATIGDIKDSFYEDKVVVSIPGKAGTYDVSVGSVFEDGLTVVDEYSGNTYVVADGKVTVSCDATGVILLSSGNTSDETAKVTAKVTKGTVKQGTYSDDEISVNINAKDMSDTTYKINERTEVSFDKTATITFGQDTAYGETTVILVSGVSTSTGEKITKKLTYKRADEPIVNEAKTKGLYVRVKKSDFDMTPYLYGWTGASYTAGWPGDLMVDEGDYYVYRNENVEGDAYAIIHTYVNGNSTWRSCPDGGTPETISGTVELEKHTNNGSFKKFIEIDDSIKVGRVNINMYGTDNQLIKSFYRVGEVGESYDFPIPSFMSNTNYDNTDYETKRITGKFTEDVEPYTFIYYPTGEIVVTEEPTNTPLPTETPEPINNTLKVVYSRLNTTPWEQAYIHYGVDNAWTSVPGIPMTLNNEGKWEYIINLGESTEAQVCFNNGANEWDSRNGSNYYLFAGAYRVDAATGTVTEIDVTATATPTVKPTVEPTATPTVEPTATPTVAPTATPTVAPTATPTVEPTATPTVEPTATPTVASTATPTVAPTATPTVEPTATPTVAPTATPTVEPTETPTVTPTSVPAERIAFVFYKRSDNSSWKNAYIHYKVDGVWTKSPGVKMEKVRTGFWLLKINMGQSSTLTVCFNNGEGKWDNNDKKNYTVGEGMYVVNSLAKEVYPSMPTELPTVVPTAKPTATPTVAPTETPVVNKAVVYYKASSPWKKVYIHYCVNGGKWTKVPGVKMTATSDRSGYNYMAIIDLNDESRASVCFNDGNGTWDSKDGQNYTVKKGIYGVKNGKVTKLD